MINTLEVDSVFKSYGLRNLLTDIYLKCHTGDIIGWLGRNGTGKSTLLKIIFGVLNADGKFVSINGQKHNQPYKIAGQIGYLPQHSFLLKELSVKSVIEMFISENNVPGFLDDAILRNLEKSKVGDLSGGELRYLEIKLLLNGNYKFVFLDEPFNGISPVLIEGVKEMIVKHSANKGIILTDHDYHHVLDVATKSYLLHDGALKQIDSLDDLIRWNYVPA